MSKCKFTIITVCYNAQDCIEVTIKSVLGQTCDDYEYIIKDGQSTDGTMENVRRLARDNEKVTIIEGRDEGIYDAMNIAVQQAKGEYVLFLNAGDIFSSTTVLEEVKMKMGISGATAIYYGNVIEISNENRHLRIYTEKNSKMWYYSLGACLCHQAMFCRLELFHKRKFDLGLRVCADREWQMYFISKHVLTEPLSITIAEVMAEGFSSANVSILEAETKYCVKKYCGGFYFVYLLLSAVKRNTFLSSIIHKTESKVSCK